jgi:glutamyl-tRNA synthetase
VRFDPAELAALSARTVHHLDYAAVRARLPATMTEAGWLAVRGNLSTVADALEWQRVIDGPVTASLAEDDRRFVLDAGQALAALSWGNDIWSRWTAALKESSGRKGRALFQPLRQALTGRDHGPEMAALLPLIGRDEALARLAL